MGGSRKRISKSKKTEKLNIPQELNVVKPNNNSENTDFTQSWYTGQVKVFNKDYGSIKCFEDGEEHFIHITNVETQPIERNDYVIFKLQPYRRKKGTQEAYQLSKVSKFINNDDDYLIEQYLKNKNEQFKIEILKNPEIGVFKIIEKVLENYQQIESDSDFKLFVKELNFLIGSINNDNIIEQLISEWARCIPNFMHQLMLWYNIVPVQLPDVKNLYESFNNVSKDIKIKIINAIPNIEKIPLLNTWLNSGLDDHTYYHNIFKIIKSIINGNNILVFDLEYDGHNVNELAYSYDGEIINATTKNEIEIELIRFQELLVQTNSFFFSWA